MMRMLPALLICLALPCAALADNETAQFDASRVSITYGAFCQVVSVGEVVAPDTLAQKIDLLPDTPEIRWPTNIIPATPGISFGVRTETADGNVISPVMIEVTHPPFPGSGTTRQSYISSLGGDGPSMNAYSFDTPEELVTGTWTLRAWQDGAVLYEVAFEVVPPALRPDITGACEGYLGS